MTTTPAVLTPTDAAATMAGILDELERAVVGKRDVLELVLLGLVADGHVLLDDLPGVAKTLTARSLAQVTNLSFSRIQFTPDLLPADITGATVFEADERRVPLPARPDLRQPRARRRGEPGAGQDAGRAARGHAGAPGHGGRDDVPPAPTVPRRRDAEPDRARGHVRAARGPARPLPAADPHGLPDRGGRGRAPHPSRRAGHRRGGADRGGLGRGDPGAAGRGGTGARRPGDGPLRRRAGPGHPGRRRGRGRRQSPRLAGPAQAGPGLRAGRGRDFVDPDDVKAVALPALAHRVVLRSEVWVRGVPQESIIERVVASVPAPSWT